MVRRGKILGAAEERLLLLLRISSLSLLDGIMAAVFHFASASFTKVIPFDETEAAETIRAQLYGGTKSVRPYSCAHIDSVASVSSKGRTSVKGADADRKSVV